LMMLLTTVRNGIRQVQSSAAPKDADHQIPRAEDDGSV
jgi:hypothetical protein